jgi:uncharacterized protein (TIRG00374 family)
MKVRGALLCFTALTVSYVVSLGWIDSKNTLSVGLRDIISAVPLLVFLATSALVLRYFRWLWLLRRAGYEVRWLDGLLAYFSGFAFTASPGKVGELLRIHYFAKLGVPPSIVLGAFIYERLFDLVTVLVFAIAYTSHITLQIVGLLFVGSVVIAVTILAIQYERIQKLAILANARHYPRLAALIRTVANGLLECRRWQTPTDLLFSAILGTLAWALTSFCLVYLLLHLNVVAWDIRLFGIYPLAMLVGAASLLPGGIGSTETALVVLLKHQNISLVTSGLCAVVVRMCTLWLAMILGLSSMFLFEVRRGQSNR